MTRERAKELLPIITAFADGKDVQFNNGGDNWSLILGPIAFDKGGCMSIVHLLSGGIDSTVMLYELLSNGSDVHCLLFNYGQSHLSELRYARATCKKLKVEHTEVELARIKNLFLHCALTDRTGPGFVVPNRNAVMLNIAASIAVGIGASVVTFGATKDDEHSFADCRQQFVNSLNTTLALAGVPATVEAPYINKTKTEIIGIGKSLNVPFEETMSCYNGNNCGRCPACRIRRKAMKSCGL